MPVVIQRTLRVGGPGLLLLVAALVFGGSGGALIALNQMDDPPALSQLDRNVGRLGGTRLHRYSGTKGGGAPYLQFTIGGLQYTLESRRLEWLDSMRRSLRRGDTLTVWSRDTPIGSGQIWQLAHGDSVIVTYAERRERKIRSNDSTTVLAEILLAIGAALLLAAWLVGRRRSGSSGVADR